MYWKFPRKSVSPTSPGFPNARCRQFCDWPDNCRGPRQVRPRITMALIIITFPQQRTYGGGQTIFPWSPPWRARGHPVPAMLFGGEARAAVNLPPRSVDPDGPPSGSQPPSDTVHFRNSRARAPYGETERAASVSCAFFPSFVKGRSQEVAAPPSILSSASPC